MTTNRYTEQPFEVGQDVFFSNTSPGLNPTGLIDGFEPGAVATISEVKQDPAYRNLLVKIDGDDCWWNVDWFDAVPDSEDDEVDPDAGARPGVDFSSSSRATAREYAAQIIVALSNLGVQHKILLGQVGSGESDVDAYELNRTLLAAMRESAHKGRNSTDRRDLGTKIAHLAHITQAVLENHVDALPAYQPGERSRLVAELKAKEASTYDALQRTRAERDSLQAALEVAREDGRAADEELEAQLNLNRDLLEIARKRDELLAETVQERGTIAEVLTYAIELLSEKRAQRVLGFWDGVKAGDVS